jgi:hypothetical protein
MRKLVSSGSPLEPHIGFSWAVRVGAFVAVAGTAPTAPGGGVAAPGLSGISDGWRLSTATVPTPKTPW